MKTALLISLSLWACDDTPLPVADASVPEHTEFLPNSECAPCHPAQVEDFARSTMHYAAFSPVFNALELALAEISDGAFVFGADGDNHNFCAGCHAPVGERRGLGSDGQRPLRDSVHSLDGDGITCDFCHRIEAITGVGTGALDAQPGALKFGPFTDPVANNFHTSAASDLITGTDLCGACHDVRLPGPDAVTGENFRRQENLFTEWQASPWAQANHPWNPLRGQPGILGLHDDRIAQGEVVTCQDCHMSQYPAVGFADAVDPLNFAEVDPASLTRKAHKLYAVGHSAQVNSPLPIRRLSSHRFTGASRPIVPFPPSAPSVDDRRVQMLQAALTLDLSDTADTATLGEPFTIDAWIENVGAGHSVPAGFSQEREVWVALTLTDIGRPCQMDTDCLDLVEPRRFVDDPRTLCTVDDPVFTGAVGLASTWDARMRRERSGVCENAFCVLYRSGYLLDRDGDAHTHDEDLRHTLIAVDPERFTEACVLPGPDADQRPAGLEQGLVSFTNQFQAIAIDAGLPVAQPQVERTPPSATPVIPSPDDPPVLHQDPRARRSLYPTQRARYERDRYRSAHLQRPAAVINPLEGNRYFNGAALRPFEPRLARYQLYIPASSVGPLKLDLRVRFRFFPPRLLRLLAQRSSTAHLVTEALIDRGLDTVDLVHQQVHVLIE